MMSGLNVLKRFFNFLSILGDALYSIYIIHSNLLVIQNNSYQ